MTSALAREQTTDDEATIQGPIILPYEPVRSRFATYDYDAYGLLVHQVTGLFEGGFAPDGSVPAGAKVKKFEVSHVPLGADQDHWLIRRFSSVGVFSDEPARDAIAASVNGAQFPPRTSSILSAGVAVGWEPGTMAISHAEVDPLSVTSDAESSQRNGRPSRHARQH